MRVLQIGSIWQISVPADFLWETTQYIPIYVYMCTYMNKDRD